MIKSNGLTQIVNKPTRVTNKSSTLLDHILITKCDRIVQTGTIPVGFSDHNMIYCTRKIVKDQIMTQNIVNIRSMKNYSKDLLIEHINKVNWDIVTLCNDTNIAWNNFVKILNVIINNIAPKKQCKVKTRTEPWVTSEILECLEERDKLLGLFHKTKDPVFYQQFCKLRNKAQRLVKTTRQEYIKEQIVNNKNNSKKLWSTLKTLGYNNKTKTKEPIVLNINEQVCYDPVTVAEHVNSFFVNIAQKLVDALPKLNDLFSAFSENCRVYYKNLGVSPAMYILQEVSSDFVLKELQSMNATKSTGLDNIGPKFLHDGAEALADTITSLINLSIRNKTVPDCTKKAKVTPLYKKKNKLDVGNYRPISVLTSLSKILEKAVHGQVEAFCKDSQIIYPLQSGFRGNFSTDTCLIYLHDYIRQEISQGSLVGMVMLDVQKAFDSVNHEMLCEKIRLAGIDPEWFKSYLQGRSQQVCVNNNMSTEQTIKAGVPQGSILGPWCYLIYSNDMASCVSCKLILYADDTILLVSDRDINKVAKELGNALSRCSHWLTNNGLSMHMGKTEAIVLSSKRKKHLTKHFVIQCNGHDIHPSDEVKYLGLKINQTLSGENIVNSILSKSAARLKFLYRHGHALDQSSRKILASALIQCHFDYAVSAWYPGLSKCLKQKLQVAQNKIVRFILNMGPRSHIGQTELTKVGLLNTSDRANQIILNHMHNIANSTAPGYLKQHFSTIKSLHSYSTRSAELNFVVPRVQGISRFNFSYYGAKLWNALPASIKGIGSKSVYKIKVKSFLSEKSRNIEQSDYIFY